MRDSTPLEFSLYRATRTHEIIRCDRKHVVPRSRSRPHLVVLQQVRINEDTQGSAVAERSYAAFVFGNPSDGARG